MDLIQLSNQSILQNSSCRLVESFCEHYGGSGVRCTTRGWRCGAAPWGNPGGGKVKSYAALVSSNLPSTWSKNVLEITLEKEAKGSFNVGEEDCVKVMKKLGLDPRPDIQVESVQICPNGRGVILITLKKKVPINKFCHHEVFQVTQSGIWAVQAKPAGKRDVVVTLKGVHPNTRDDGVLDYLSKYGKILSTKVVYAVFGEGPLKGIRNGDRMYKIEIKPNSYLGTYHVIDGQRVTARYPGQQQTCARCFGTPNSCPGKGLARRCEQEGGVKIEFNDYISQLWARIGYVPSQVELSSETNDEHTSQESNGFTPIKTAPMQDPASYTGVRVSTFPKDTDEGKIVEFLINSGLSESYKDNITIKQNGSVMIDNLPNKDCIALIEAVHNKVNFGKKLYCNGVIPCTPEKVDSPRALASSTQSSSDSSSSRLEGTPPSSSSLPNAAISTPATSNLSEVQLSIPPNGSVASESASIQSVGQPSTVLQPQPSHVQANIGTGTDITTSKNSCRISPSLCPVSPMSPNTFSEQYSETPDITHLHLSTQDLVRRNSLSLRSPPPGSLADEILSTDNYARAKSILTNLKEMADKYSDFASCDSSLGESEKEVDDGFKVQSKKKKSRKHKLSPSPDNSIKNFFLKKANKASSPEYLNRK